MYETLITNKLFDEKTLDITKPRNITMDMFWGPFLFLFIGVIVSFIAAVIEIYYFKKTGKV